MIERETGYVAFCRAVFVIYFARALLQIDVN